MKKRNLFYKKSHKFLINVIILSFLFSLMLFLSLFIFYSKQKFFIVHDFIETFYIIPENKGGVKILNLDKKSLHIDDKKTSNLKIINDSMLEYSIQIYSSSDYNLVKERLDFLINHNTDYMKNYNLKTNDFFIVIFNSHLDREYMLIYKNFSQRKLANNYCLKHLIFFKKCLIVNVQSLN